MRMENLQVQKLLFKFLCNKTFKHKNNAMENQQKTGSLHVPLKTGYSINRTSTSFDMLFTHFVVRKIDL